MRAIHQLLAGGMRGNAVVAEALAIEQAARQWGYTVHTYCPEPHPSVAGSILPLAQCRSARDDLLLLHLTTGSTATDFCMSQHNPLAVIYHNITPPSYLLGLGKGLSEHSRSARTRLPELAKRAALGIAHSTYSEQEMKQVEFKRTQVVPVVVTHALEEAAQRNASSRVGRIPEATLLHVGRVVPNKRLEDIIKVYYYYQKINNLSKLIFVGDATSAIQYYEWLQRLVRAYKLDSVQFTGQIGPDALAREYRKASLYLTMSDHEGFCVPLVESMRFGVPIVAYASSAIPETLGNSGVLAQRKDYADIASMVHLLHQDTVLRSQVIYAQMERAKAFEPELVLDQLRQALEPVLSP